LLIIVPRLFLPPSPSALTNKFKDLAEILPGPAPCRTTKGTAWEIRRAQKALGARRWLDAADYLD
jgi:hypothetical protein